jgi:hypothetical protein
LLKKLRSSVMALFTTRQNKKRKIAAIAKIFVTMPTFSLLLFDTTKTGGQSFVLSKILIGTNCALTTMIALVLKADREQHAIAPFPMRLKSFLGMAERGLSSIGTKNRVKDFELLKSLFRRGFTQRTKFSTLN